uniref:uncharacterized protein LOC120330209 isoform X2 n=1 Tax=Styela clava TaxID=7725 RepID=UPI00193965E9|nr:uncharacterized protein LOC120330209 isoform X2 [Styela clava]
MTSKCQWRITMIIKEPNCTGMGPQIRSSPPRQPNAPGQRIGPQLVASHRAPNANQPTGKPVRPFHKLRKPNPRFEQRYVPRTRFRVHEKPIRPLFGKNRIYINPKLASSSSKNIKVQSEDITKSKEVEEKIIADKAEPKVIGTSTNTYEPNLEIRKNENSVKCQKELKNSNVPQKDDLGKNISVSSGNDIEHSNAYLEHIKKLKGIKMSSAVSMISESKNLKHESVFHEETTKESSVKHTQILQISQASTVFKGKCIVVNKTSTCTLTNQDEIPDSKFHPDISTGIKMSSAANMISVTKNLEHGSVSHQETTKESNIDHTEIALVSQASRVLEGDCIVLNKKSTCTQTKQDEVHDSKSQPGVSTESVVNKSTDSNELYTEPISKVPKSEQCSNEALSKPLMPLIKPEVSDFNSTVKTSVKIEKNITDSIEPVQFTAVKQASRKPGKVANSVEKSDSKHRDSDIIAQPFGTILKQRVKGDQEPIVSHTETLPYDEKETYENEDMPTPDDDDGEFVTLDSWDNNDTSKSTTRRKASDFFDEDKDKRIGPVWENVPKGKKINLRGILKRKTEDNKQNLVVTVKSPAILDKTRPITPTKRVKPTIRQFETEPNSMVAVPSIEHGQDLQAEMRLDNAMAAGLEFINPISGYHCLLCHSFYPDYPTALHHCTLLTHKMKVLNEQKKSSENFQNPNQIHTISPMNPNLIQINQHD